MRALFLALLIAVLPLRSWLGDVMALERIAPVPTAQSEQVTAHGDAHAAGDCHGAMGHPDAGAADASPGDGDCHGCTACQICHSVALGVAPPPAITAVRPTLAPPTSLPRYVSAERAPGFKPPIS